LRGRDDVVWVFDGTAVGNTIAALDSLTGEDALSPGDPPKLPSMFGGSLTTTGDFELNAGVVPATNRQETSLTVSSKGAVLWTAIVPGFEAGFAGSSEQPAVLVIDQTGGTGAPGPMHAGMVDSRLTAYSAASGERLWQVPLPGAPHVIAPISADVAVVPVGTELHAIDVATGATRWTAGQPSPGRGGDYSLDGTVWFVAPGSATTAVAVGFAERPYRD